MFCIFSHIKKCHMKEEKNHYTVIGKNKLDFKQKRIISENVKKMNFFRGV